MKYLALLALVALASSARSPVQTNEICQLLQDIESFIKPGLLDWFDNQCVPQISAQIDACHGELQKEVKQMVAQMCSEVSSEVEGLVNKLPAFLKNVLAPLFTPDGPFDVECNADLDSYLLKQIEAQCAVIGKLDPKQVCDDAFNEVWSSLTGMLNNKFC